MPERQNFRCAPGDDCLPDLTIAMPIDYDRMNSTPLDKRLIDSALEEPLAQYEPSRNKRDHRAIDHVSLNAFDEHDSDSDERHAATIVQQMMCLQKGCRGGEDASRRSQQQAHHGLGSPMLQRWLGQSPRQEGFNGVATAQALSRSATKSQL